MKLSVKEKPMLTPEYFNCLGAEFLPGYLGIRTLEVGSGRLRTSLDIGEHHLAPHRFLHAGTIVSLADTTAGYGCFANLPEGATGFTTLELKSNHFGTARYGSVECLATAVHLGETTQVWDAAVTECEAGKLISTFRCTQLIFYPRKRLPEIGTIDS
ncbi:MAG: PaaI family thioesterase [Candidatus Brocadiia bacterium]